jgi:hypothetical protein
VVLHWPINRNESCQPKWVFDVSSCKERTEAEIANRQVKCLSKPTCYRNSSNGDRGFRCPSITKLRTTMVRSLFLQLKDWPSIPSFRPLFFLSQQQSANVEHIGNRNQYTAPNSYTFGCFLAAPFLDHRNRKPRSFAPFEGKLFFQSTPRNLVGLVGENEGVNDGKRVSCKRLQGFRVLEHLPASLPGPITCKARVRRVAITARASRRQKSRATSARGGRGRRIGRGGGRIGRRSWCAPGGARARVTGADGTVVVGIQTSACAWAVEAKATIDSTIDSCFATVDLLSRQWAIAILLRSDREVCGLYFILGKLRKAVGFNELERGVMFEETHIGLEVLCSTACNTFR